MKLFISNSRSILFTYSSDSILSSGALIYSLNFLKQIIGPNVGFFHELKEIVRCYNNFEEISNIPINEGVDEFKIKSYINKNQWYSFPDKFNRLMQS